MSGAMSTRAILRCHHESYDTGYDKGIPLEESFASLDATIIVGDEEPLVLKNSLRQHVCGNSVLRKEKVRVVEVSVSP